jgi:hypothetical protein
MTTLALASLLQSHSAMLAAALLFHPLLLQLRSAELCQLRSVQLLLCSRLPLLLGRAGLSSWK